MAGPCLTLPLTVRAFDNNTQIGLGDRGVEPVLSLNLGLKIDIPIAALVQALHNFQLNQEASGLLEMPKKAPAPAVTSMRPAQAAPPGLTATVAAAPVSEPPSSIAASREPASLSAEVVSWDAEISTLQDGHAAYADKVRWRGNDLKREKKPAWVLNPAALATFKAKAPEVPRLGHKFGFKTGKKDEPEKVAEIKAPEKAAPAAEAPAATGATAAPAVPVAAVPAATVPTATVPAANVRVASGPVEVPAATASAAAPPATGSSSPPAGPPPPPVPITAASRAISTGSDESGAEKGHLLGPPPMGAPPPPPPDATNGLNKGAVSDTSPVAASGPPLKAVPAKSTSPGVPVAKVTTPVDLPLKAVPAKTANPAPPPPPLLPAASPVKVASKGLLNPPSVPPPPKDGGPAVASAKGGSPSQAQGKECEQQ